MASMLALSAPPDDAARPGSRALARPSDSMTAAAARVGELVAKATTMQEAHQREPVMALEFIPPVIDGAEAEPAACGW